MKKWLISYDLNVPGQNYKGIDKELVRLGAARVLYSQWVLASSSSAAELRDYFKNFLDSNDRLLVSSLQDWAAWNAMIDINKVAA